MKFRYGIYMNYARYCTIEYNVITNSESRGIDVNHGRNLVFKNNNASGDLVGLDFGRLDNFTITKNIVHNSKFGMATRSNLGNSIITNNTAFDCEFGFSGQIDVSGGIFEDNTAFSNGVGFAFHGESDCGLYRNLAYDNNVGFQFRYSERKN